MLNFFSVLVCLFGVHALHAASHLPLESFVKTETTQFLRKKAVPGAAIAIFFEGKEYYIEIGYADLSNLKGITPDTLFQIGSITKVFTSTLIALEVLGHKATLTDPVSKFTGIRGNNEGLSQVTLQNLATHTSSLPRDPPFLPNHPRYSQQQLIEFLRQWHPSKPIGVRYVYSNLGFALLGFAAGNIEGMDYFSALQRYILNPLGMDSTVVNVPQVWQSRFAQGYNKVGKPVKQVPPQVWPGGGALRSSARDMMKFLKANLNLYGPLDIRKAMQLAQKSSFRVNDQLILGLGWQRVPTGYGQLIIEKNGGVAGFSSYIGMLPNKKMGVVILLNKGKTGITDLGRKMLKILQNEKIG